MEGMIGWEVKHRQRYSIPGNPTFNALSNSSYSNDFSKSVS